MVDLWQDQTDDTLRRIEAQVDDSDKQEGVAFNFREKVLLALSRIELSLEQNEKDHVEIKSFVNKIPSMELGLNNHLHTHDTMKKYVFYPVSVGVILTLIGLLIKVVLKVL